MYTYEYACVCLCMFMLVEMYVCACECVHLPCKCSVNERDKLEMKSKMNRVSQDRKSSGKSPKGSGLLQKYSEWWVVWLCIELQLLTLAKKRVEGERE